MSPVLELSGVAKNFVMHLQGGVNLSVISGVNLSVRAGECAVLVGPSGAGKSSILKMIFGSYRCERGTILVRQEGNTVDVAKASPREILSLRKSTIGSVTQFLRAVPRVAALDVVAEPLVARGVARDAARQRAVELLKRLNIPTTLWGLPPATFSGGEQQRVNIARGFICDFPLLLLDEPTASLDAANGEIVTQMVAECKQAGGAVLAIVHDHQVRDRIADTLIDVASFSRAA